MNDPPDLPRRVLRAVRAATERPLPADTYTDIVHDPAADVSEQRRATAGELEVLDLLHLPHPRAYVRMSREDWAIVDSVAGALAQARHHEEGTA